MSDESVQVWEASLDNGAFTASVERTAPYRGLLQVRDADGNTIHRQVMGLAYDARFGPDVDDVATWMDAVTTVVDNPERRSVDAE
jgi:hypothetical protein